MRTRRVPCKGVCEECCQDRHCSDRPAGQRSCVDNVCTCKGPGLTCTSSPQCCAGSLCCPTATGAICVAGTACSARTRSVRLGPSRSASEKNRAGGSCGWRLAPEPPFTSVQIAQALRPASARLTIRVPCGSARLAWPSLRRRRRCCGPRVRAGSLGHDALPTFMATENAATRDGRWRRLSLEGRQSTQRPVMERWAVRRRTKCASELSAESALPHDAQEFGPHRKPPHCGFTPCPERGVIVQVIPPANRNA